MDQIKTTTETIIAYGNDTWENLGNVTLYRFMGYHGDQEVAGSGTILFKMVPGLGKRFKVVFKDTVYSLEKNTTERHLSYNAYIGEINCYLNVEGFE